MLDVNRLARLSDDRALACDLLFAHRHPQASPPFHTTMIDLWRCADRFVLFEAFRGAGKTTKAEEHAGVVWPQYGVTWVFRAEPQLVRWPTLKRKEASA